MSADIPVTCVAHAKCRVKLTEATAVWIDGLPYCRPHFGVFRAGEKPDLKPVVLMEKRS